MTCSFVPPYLLQHLADIEDDHALRACGQATLTVDDQLRSRRSHPPTSLLAPSTRAPDHQPSGSSSVAGKRSAASIAAAAPRVIHTADNTETLPGAPVRRDGDPASGDAAVDEAFDSSGQVWDLFATAFNRQSVDAQATPLSVTVHYGRNYDNAFWDGTQLVFGDGDGTVFDRFTKPMDVLAHEFTHGVTQFTAGLNYEGQSGALNESVSDAFASMTKQRMLGQTSTEADWLIGVGLFLPGVQARALRSMQEPGTAYDDPRLGHDPQVGSMSDYGDTTDDNGGVHINSGIPNRAFCLLAIALGGSSWERPGQIWYDALTAGEVTAETDFVGFAQATVSSAGRLFPDDPSVAEQVTTAWTTVGVLSASGASAPGGPDTATPGDPAPARVAVRRTGGYAAIVRTAEVDLVNDPAGPELRGLLDRVDLRGLAAPSKPASDRFVYTVEYAGTSTTLGEADLTPELGQVIRLVLGDQ